MAYTDLDDASLMQLAIERKHDSGQRAFHDYVQIVRDYVDGRDVIEVPQSHRSLSVGENHEGGHRLNVRIKQAASWLAGGTLRASVTAGSSEYREQAEQMEKFARYGEIELGRSKMLHKWRREAARDIFECGLSIIQSNPTREFYVQARGDRTLMTRGARLTDIQWRRRVDPLWAWWGEGDDGNVDSFLIEGNRSLSALAKLISDDVYDQTRKTFAWAESLPDSRVSFSGETIKVDELWTGDIGALIYSGEVKRGKGSRVAADDPRRIIAKWRNLNPRRQPPFYFTAATTAPYHSPLDEMIALTGLRNYYATMLDRQAAGAVYRHWQLKDTNSGSEIAPQLWSNPVPETVLLDLSKPPPNMGPGTEWVLAPFEFHDLLPRYQIVVAQHESAGEAVARLMGQAINANTAVGTADIMEDYARREMSDIIEATQETYAAMWGDQFAHYRRYHTREPIVVAARLRDKSDMKFKQTHLELRGQDVVAEDVSFTLDTRTRMALIADYRIGREMQTNGDISFDRRVEMGLVPYVDDAAEEKADIFLDQVENITLETEAMAHQMAVAQSLGVGQPAEAMPPPPANITRGARTDPRGTGTGRGPNNISDSALAMGATDTVRSA